MERKINSRETPYGASWAESRGKFLLIFKWRRSCSCRSKTSGWNWKKCQFVCSFRGFRIFLFAKYSYLEREKFAKKKITKINERKVPNKQQKYIFFSKEICIIDCFTYFIREKIVFNKNSPFRFKQKKETKIKDNDDCKDSSLILHSFVFCWKKA